METLSNKSANQILLEAAFILEEERKWHKGSYFQPLYDRPGCAMCAHGAIAYCGDPEVKINVDKGYADGAVVAIREAGIAGAGSATKQYYSDLASKEGLPLEDYLVKRFGQTGLAHYKATQAGLTTRYNDAPSTTQQDVVRKLRKAAQY